MARLGAAPGTNEVARRTLGAMLRQMRDATGGPNVRIRLLALAVAIGLLLLSAPMLIPVLRWALDVLT